MANLNAKLESGYVVRGESSNKLVTEKLEVSTSSCAGANSSGFDLYRAARKRERLRLEEMDRQAELEKKKMDLEARVAKNRLEDELRTKKNAEKRKKKKDRRNAKKLHGKQGVGAPDNAEESSSGDESDSEPEKRQKVSADNAAVSESVSAETTSEEKHEWIEVET